MALFKISKIILENTLKKPATLMYPKKPAKKYPETRGHITNDIKKCIFCGACQRICPTYAIYVNNKERVWEIDRMKCCTCRACIETCPVKSLSMDNTYIQPLTKKDGKQTLKGEPKPQKQQTKKEE